MSRISAKTMAASKANRRMGCRVTSAAFTGSRQKETKSDVVARRAWYSGSDRPAWRMNQIGGRSATSPDRTRRSLGVGVFMAGDLERSGGRASSPGERDAPSCYQYIS